MYCGFSSPMTTVRSQNKERLEASLAWLCELELLKQRQESLVLNALSLGDIVPGQPAWGDLQPARTTQSDILREQEDLTLRRQLNSLHGAPWGLMLALEQQLRELSLEAPSSLSPPPPSPAPAPSLSLPPLHPSTCCQDHNASEEEDEDSRPSSGFYEQSESLSPPSAPCHSTLWSSSHHRPKSVDCSLLNGGGEEYRESSSRAILPRSHSAPFSPLEDIAEGPGEEEEVAVDPEENLEDEEEEEPWPEAPEPEALEVVEDMEDIQQALRVEAYILSLLQRRTLRPRQTYGGFLPSRGPGAYSSNRPAHPITVPTHTEVTSQEASELEAGWIAPAAARAPVVGGAFGNEEARHESELEQGLEQYYLSLLYPSSSRPPSLAVPTSIAAAAPPSQQYHTELASYSSSTDPESLQSNPEYGEPYPPMSEHKILTVNYVPPSHSSSYPHPYAAIPSYPQTHLQAQPCSPFHSKHKPSRGSGGAQKLQSPVRSSPCKASGVAEARSPQRGLGKKKSSATIATGTSTSNGSTSRSRSDNSLQGGVGASGGGGAPGAGWGCYYTVQRDSTRARRQVQDGGLPPQKQQRRWCSTADLSQEEEEGGGGYGAHIHPSHIHAYAHPHPAYQGVPHHSHQHLPQAHPRQAWSPPPHLCAPQYRGQEHRAIEGVVANDMKAAGAGAASAGPTGGSDSSLSEAYSPGSSSFTSDSDESGGGLVWPQEVPPRLASSPPPALSSVVKIKASHALKKKIMRFRSGSLKVMTTV